MFGLIIDIPFLSEYNKLLENIAFCSTSSFSELGEIIIRMSEKVIKNHTIYLIQPYNTFTSVYVHTHIHYFPIWTDMVPSKIQTPHNKNSNPTSGMKIPLLSCWPGLFKRLSEHIDYFYCPWLLPGDGS